MFVSECVLHRNCVSYVNEIYLSLEVPVLTESDER